MGANHSHARSTPGSPTARRAAIGVIVPVALATLIALIWLWPQQRPASDRTAGPQRVTGTIIAITLTPCPEPPPEEGTDAQAPLDPATCGTATIELTSGAESGKYVTSDLPSGPGAPVFAVGDDVVLNHTPGSGLDAPFYQISDHDRSSPLWLVLAAFALAVIAFGRWRGLTALLGLAVTFVLLLTFILPAILAGQPPLLVAIVGSAAIMIVVLFLTHGFTLTIAMAVLGTLVSLTLTGVLSYLAIGFARLNGITDDSSFLLGMSHQINAEGLLLASIIIGSLGVLDDVTVTQAATVAELARANPSSGFGRLYRAAGRIGRAHIASVINTIVLAYAGASLPLLLLINIGGQPIDEVVTNPLFAQEIVRAVVGTLGLIAAVPVTTALAALLWARRPAPDGDAPPPSHPVGRPNRPAGGTGSASLWSARSGDEA